MGSLEVLFWDPIQGQCVRLFYAARRQQAHKTLRNWWAETTGSFQRFRLLHIYNKNKFSQPELLVLNRSLSDGEEISVSFQMIIRAINTRRPFVEAACGFSFKMNYSQVSERCNEFALWSHCVFSRMLQHTVVSMCRVFEFWLQDSLLSLLSSSVLIASPHVICR